MSALPSRAEPPITISKETTYITEPLRDDGLPDYERYLRERYSQGVTPDNNAAVLLWQAMGPGDSEPEEFAAVAKAIGMKRVPTKEQSLQSVALTGSESIRDQIATWLQGRGALPPKPTNDDFLENRNYEAVITDVLQFAKAQPWTADEIPPLGEWITRNQIPLELLVEASTRSRYYSPEAAWVNDKRDSLLLAMSTQNIQATRGTSGAFVTRVMFHAGNGQFESAWRDLLAAHRLTRLWVRDSVFLVDELLAKACMNSVLEATRVVLADPRLPADQARQILDDLNALGQPKFGIDTFDIGERVFTLDLLLTLMKGSEEFDPILVDLKNAIKIVESGPVDWNIILTEVNRRYDLFVAAMKIPDRMEREQKLETMQETQPDLDSKELAALDRHERSIAFAAAFDPADTSTSWLLDGQWRTLTQVDATRLAAALALFRAEHDHYPDRLEETVPTIIKELPVDSYNELPYVYRRTENGYLLYTKGKNGIDDDGSNHDLGVYRGYSADVNLYESVRLLLGSDAPELPADFNPAQAKWSEEIWEFISPLRDHIPKDADDIALRVPLPKLELPQSK